MKLAGDVTKWLNNHTILADVDLCKKCHKHSALDVSNCLIKHSIIGTDHCVVLYSPANSGQNMVCRLPFTFQSASVYIHVGDVDTLRVWVDCRAQFYAGRFYALAQCPKLCRLCRMVRTAWSIYVASLASCLLLYPVTRSKICEMPVSYPRRLLVGASKA